MRTYPTMLATLYLTCLGAWAGSNAEAVPQWLTDVCVDCPDRMSRETGVYILAAEQLLSAAERGVRVRVLVGRWKRFKSWFNRILPLEPVL